MLADLVVGFGLEVSNGVVDEAGLPPGTAAAGADAAPDPPALYALGVVPGSAIMQMYSLDVLFLRETALQGDDGGCEAADTQARPAESDSHRTRLDDVVESDNASCARTLCSLPLALCAQEVLLPSHEHCLWIHQAELEVRLARHA